jgi:hypothetical protein
LLLPCRVRRFRPRQQPDADRFSAGLIPTADDIEGYRHDQSSELAARANCIRCDKNVAASNISHSIRGILRMARRCVWKTAHERANLSAVMPEPGIHNPRRSRTGSQVRSVVMDFGLAGYSPRPGMTAVR